MSNSPSDLAIASFPERHRRLFRDASRGGRLLNTYRPYVCPLKPILDFVKVGSTVLDIGCGSGLALLNLAIEGKLAKGLGIEISESAFKDAMTAAEALRSCGIDHDIRFEIRSPEEVLNHIPNWDVVMLIDVIHHVPAAIQQKFLENTFSLVAPGGCLIYKDMCLKPWWRSWANRLHDALIARQWICYFPIKKVKSLAEAKGFKTVTEQRYSALWYGHELLVLEKIQKEPMLPRQGACTHL